MTHLREIHIMIIFRIAHKDILILVLLGNPALWIIIIYVFSQNCDWNHYRRFFQKTESPVYFIYYTITF